LRYQKPTFLVSGLFGLGSAFRSVFSFESGESGIISFSFLISIGFLSGAGE